MGIEFRLAVRENASTLIALAGPSGGGKTYTALRIARGLAGPTGRIAFIDTEAGRATHYADRFKFDHADMKPPFSPDAFRQAIEAADKQGYAVIVIDSMSHEWMGDGGVIDMQESELQRMAGNDYGKREACKMAAWIKPKMAHKRMMSRLLQCRAHLIFCLRAEEKVKMEKVSDRDGRQKTVIVPIGWQPICEKNFMYEQTASFLLADTKAHVPEPIKLQEQHQRFFPAGHALDESSGTALGAWARSGKVTQSAKAPIPEPTADAGHDATDEGSATPADSVSEVVADTPIDDALQMAYDDIVAYIAGETDPDAIKRTWAADANVPKLKTERPELYAQALSKVNARLREIRK